MSPCARWIWMFCWSPSAALWASRQSVARLQPGRLFSRARRVTGRLSDWQLKRLKPTIDAGKLTAPSSPAGDDPTLCRGLVVERQGSNLLVELTEAQQGVVCVCSQTPRLNEFSSIVVGDRVRVKTDNGASEIKGCIMGLEKRSNILQRPSVDSSIYKLKLKPIASNVDQLIAVIAPVPATPVAMVDRYLVAAIAHSIPNTVILVNKADLDGTTDLMQTLKYYESLGHRLLAVSATSGVGMASLMNLLQNRTSIFIGQSGVGKSSLVNAICPGANIKVAELVKRVQLGAHATSNAKLHHLPFGGNIIDSPGIREIGLWHFNEQEIKAGFPDITELAIACKFRNCKHNASNDSHCAVIKAVNGGNLPDYRYKAYIRLMGIHFLQTKDIQE